MVLLADFLGRQSGDGGPQRAVRRDDAVIALPVLVHPRDEIGEPVEELKRCEFHDTIGSWPRRLPSTTHPRPS
jgi:hypothetical protein